jgi:hypothetical protein
MVFRYPTGEEVPAGDRILWHGDPAVVEFIAGPGDRGTSWYFAECGAGFMVHGAVETVYENSTDDLTFISRKPSAPEA